MLWLPPIFYISPTGALPLASTAYGPKRGGRPYSFLESLSQKRQASREDVLEAGIEEIR